MEPEPLSAEGLKEVKEIPFGSERPRVASGVPIPLNLDPAYGWVLVMLLLAVLLFLFLAMNVVRARVRFGVKPPDVYAVKGVTGRESGMTHDADATLLRLSSRECDTFNCFQRAHQHAIEMYTVFLPLLLTGGLGFPLTTAFGGFIFLLGTLIYALGYYTVTTFMLAIELLLR